MTRGRGRLARTAGTGFGSSGTSSVFSVIVTGASPLLVTFHDTVVSPVAGSHSAFAAYTTEGAAGSAASIVVVGAAGIVVAGSVSSPAVVVAGSVVGRHSRRRRQRASGAAVVGGVGRRRFRGRRQRSSAASQHWTTSWRRRAHTTDEVTNARPGHEQEAAAALGHVVPLLLKASRSAARNAATVADCAGTAFTTPRRTSPACSRTTERREHPRCQRATSLHGGTLLRRQRIDAVTASLPPAHDHG